MKNETGLPCQVLELIDDFCRVHGLSVEQKNRMIKRYEKRLRQILTERQSESPKVRQLTAEINRLNAMTSEN